MNKTLIIYDLNGVIINQTTGFYKIPNGIPYLEVEIPQGKRVASVDIENKQPIYEDIPPTEMEILVNKISILEAENEKLKQELSITQDAVNELIFNSLNM